MTDTREKLIELIASMVCDTYSEACEEWLPHDCGKCYANNCHIAEIADHLIANGVAISNLETTTMQKWIPVTERLPEEKGFYLTARKRDVFVEQWNGVWFSERCHHAQPTHWMPLPEAPKEGVDNG